MDKLPVGQLPDLQQSNNDDEIMVITNSEYNQLKKEKISDLITDFTSTNENNALTKGTDGKLFVTDFGNASNITEGTLPTSVLPEIPLEKIPDIPKDKLPDIEITDLPASGVTADTYAYPSSVTVNAQGQVTAIEAGEPGANNANQDLSNISEAGKEVIRETAGSDYHLTQNQITNCLLEVPQRINVELNNGTLTLKAGSVVIVPYGTSAPTLEIGDNLNGGEIVDISWDSSKLFYFVKYQEFTTTNTGSNYQALLNISPSGTWSSCGVIHTYSGTTAPSVTTNMSWYDTGSNIVKRASNSGTTWENYYSLPFIVVTYGDGVVASIDNVFNGFGFIGSTIWCDKGVKGLAPDGRNADGSLKNIEFETTNVLIYTRNYSVVAGQTQYLFLMRDMSGDLQIGTYNQYDESATAPTFTNYDVYFNYEQNIMYFNNNNNTWSAGNAVKLLNIDTYTNTENGKIDNISEVKQVFRAVDYNDTGFIAHQAMPSSAINLSLGVSGSQYTMPADGFIRLSGVASASTTYMTIAGSSGTYSGMCSRSLAANVDGYGTTVPVSRGEVIQINYQNLSSSKIGFQFIYANGSK